MVYEFLGQSDAVVLGSGSSLLLWLVLLAAMALMPFLLTMITSFAKLVVVGGILRQALGTQQVPPNSVITGLALVLTVHIMWPVMTQGFANYQQALVPPERSSAEPQPGDAGIRLIAILEAVVPPVESFLIKHSHPVNVDLFRSMRSRLDQQPVSFEGHQDVLARGVEAATVLAPAFAISELTEAFQIGFLLFVPFVIIDLVVSNILMAMGMHMLAPTTISLPLKLLLFVLIDGWRMVVQGLVAGYV